MSEHNTKLTSSEIASLWTAYMDDSMSQCVLGEMQKHIENDGIRETVQLAYDMSANHTKELTTIFDRENYKTPTGFNQEDDVYHDAPWLFSDIFCLSFVNHMSILSLVAYSGALSMSFRPDIRDYFTQCLSEAIELYNQSSDIGLEKGINPRTPHIEVPKEVDFIGSKDYLRGLNPFSEKRPLNAIEISYLYTNILTNAIGSNLSLAFAQTSPNNDVQEFMLHANDLAKKHIQSFVSPLTSEDLQIPKLPDVDISNSTTQTFSDKLVMFHMTEIIAAGIGNYATASATSQRMDLSAKYQKASLQAAKLAKSGADIMIKYNWLEQPPSIKNRQRLARDKE
ncbi:MAG TPA: DUF3231 family protein [Virgibacillus sp.]|nr:DUF3231 family protein [Virgibacillus sp.]